ncbi:hypothetical protein V7056_18080 [Bacillus sp. JJ664]
MKKILISCLVLVVLITFGFSFYKFVPMKVNESLKGVEYQLGTGNDKANSVTIKIKGKLHQSFLGKRTFKGSIDVKGANYSFPNKDRKLEIDFDQNGMGTMVYGYVKNGEPHINSYGILFANKDFSKVTFEEFREDKNGNQGWSGENGWMVTGPANSKSEALIISNELMKKVLHSKIK